MKFDTNALIDQLVSQELAKTPDPLLNFDTKKAERVVKRALEGLEKAIEQANAKLDAQPDINPLALAKIATQLSKAMDDVLRMTAFAKGQPDARVEVTERTFSKRVEELSVTELRQITQTAHVVPLAGVDKTGPLRGLDAGDIQEGELVADNRSARNE